MVMEGLEVLMNRARGTVAAALAHRSRPADKSETTSPRGTKQSLNPRAKTATRSPHRKSETRPHLHEETIMRGHYEGVPLQEYLAPNPHTVGVPVPDVHPATPRRPPVHPRPTGSQDQVGIPQARPPLSRNHNASSSNPHLARPTSAHPSHRDYYGSERHIYRGRSGDSLQYDYGSQITSTTVLRSPSSSSAAFRSVESVWSDRSQHSRSRSSHRRSAERSGSAGSHRQRHSPDDSSRRRRRSNSPPPVRRSRSRESRRSRREGSGRVHENRAPSGPTSPVGSGNSSGVGRQVSSVYTISGRDCPAEATQPHHQIQHIRNLQPVQPQVVPPEVSLAQKWKDALCQAISQRDIKPIKPLLPTSEEVIDFCGQQQVIALVCGIITAFLMVLALSSSDWLLAQGWRQGLFAHCIGDGAPKPLPFQINAEVGCHTARDEPYIMASAALCVICLLLDVFATLMTGLGLSSNDPAVKTRYYRIAVWVMTVALIAILIALILYPVFFAQELELGNRTLWEFGWAYGVGWGAAIFLFGAVVLLLCDQEEEEIYYKERTIIHAENDSRA
ncbi:filaggrin-2 isoform X2 [Palaemon carinicauda]|uniref:filaggrin-2 isoform X2 n=1 Tax=Palaemon carinicauda TaxID=392227 RepID=UPI0035B5983F